MVGPQFFSDLVFDWLEIHVNSCSRKALDEIRVGRPGPPWPRLGWHVGMQRKVPETCQALAEVPMSQRQHPAAGRFAPSVHAGRIARGDRHHRHFDRALVARCAGRARIGPPLALFQ